MFIATYWFLNVFAVVQISDLLGTPHQATQNCEPNTAQLGNLLSYACSNVFDSAACRSNFFQAIRANNNQPSISQLSLYADIYFSDTQYSECVAIIDAATPSANGICVSGYCGFVRCLRRINSDILIAQCYSEASLFNEEQEDPVVLYKNITSCILATTRCSRINPITGQPQTNRLTTISYNRFGKPVHSSVPLYNALQINQAGDLRIIALPGSTSIQRYLCPYEFNLRETSWMEYSC